MNTPRTPRSPGTARPEDAARPAADNTLPPDDARDDERDGRSDVAGSGNSLGDGRSAGGQDSDLRRERGDR